MAVDDKGNWTQVNLGEGEKQKDGTYLNNSWGYCRFVGKAHAKANLLVEKGRIVLTEAKMSNAYKDKETGKTMWSKSPTITVFNFEVFGAEESTPNKSQALPPIDPDDSIPF